VRIRISTPAQIDLLSIADFIREKNPVATEKTVIHVLDVIESLRIFPNCGRSGRVISTRELVVNQTPFIVIYRVRDDTIWILRIIHGAQRWPARDKR
jgi:toxin ParE1/3/4